MNSTMNSQTQALLKTHFKMNSKMNSQTQALLKTHFKMNSKMNSQTQALLKTHFKMNSKMNSQTQALLKTHFKMNSKMNSQTQNNYFTFSNVYLALPLLSIAGGTGPVWIPVPTKLFPNWGSMTFSVMCTCESCPWRSTIVRLSSLGFRVKKAVASILVIGGIRRLKPGTDVHKFPIQVCCLWWVSDKVPQGRGFVPEQLLV